MQGNTCVLVTAPDHPRTGTAGRVVSAAPYVPTAPAAAAVLVLKAAADQATAHAAELMMQLQALDAQHDRAVDAAEAAHVALANAQRAAGPDGAPMPESVDVAFDLDGAVEAVPVASLRELG